MAVSDQLTKLATRAQELEDRAATAQDKAKADLQRDVEDARQAAQAQGDALRESAEASKGEISAWWDGVQRSWSEHLAAVRESVDDKRAARDVNSAQRAAERADDDASFAISYADAAMQEAEYAVLDATLAHMEADELARA